MYDISGYYILLWNSFVILLHLVDFIFDFINSTAPWYDKNAFLVHKDLFRDLVTFSLWSLSHFCYAPPWLRFIDVRHSASAVLASSFYLLIFLPPPLLSFSLILEDGLTTWTAPFAWISISKIVDPRLSFPDRRRRYPFLVWINSLDHTASVEYFWIIFKFLILLLLSIIHATLFTRPRYFLSASIADRPYSVLDISLRQIIL